MKTLAIFVAFVLAFGMTHSAFAHKSQIVGDYEIEVGWQNEPPLVGHENAITIMITNAPQDEHDEEIHNEETSDITHMQEEHEKILEEHEQMMQEHDEAMQGNMDKADVEEMIRKHMLLMEEHEMIMEEHESMQDQMTQEEWDAMVSSHKQIRQDHEQMKQDHEKIIEMYGIEESEHEDHDSMTHDEAEHDHEEGISGLESSLESYITLNGKQTDLEFVEDPNTPGLYVANYTPNETGHPVVHLVATINGEVFEIDFHPEEVEEHLMSPLEQQNEGVPPNKVKCSNDKVLMSKTNDGSAICVTQPTAEKLLARNWAKYF